MTPPPDPYTPRPVFIGFHNRPNRWATLVTHRRAGKTVALVNDVILAARTPLPPTHPDPQYAFIGPTYKQTKRVAWNYMKRFSRPYWTKPPSESELRVTLTNNAIIYCLGTDNADSLRGMYLDGFVGDEYALWKPSVFSQIIRPTLSDRNGWGVFSGTPKGKNLFYDQFRRAQRDPLRHFLLLLRADQSGIIPPQELKDLRHDMDPEEFAQEYLCSFDSALKGAIYAQEVNDLFATPHRLHVGPPLLFDPNLPTNFVFDLGFTDSTVRIAYQLPPHRGLVHIVNVKATQGVDIFTHIDDLRSFPGTLGNIHLPHDARAKNLQTGRSIVEQFISFNLIPRMVPHHNVRDGINATRRLFPRLVFEATPYDLDDPYGDNPTSDLIEACKQYHREWDEDKLMFTDIPVHDWSSDYADALRYLAMAVGQELGLSQTGETGVESPGRVLLHGEGYNLETLYLDNKATSRTMP